MPAKQDTSRLTVRSRTESPIHHDAGVLYLDPRDCARFQHWFRHQFAAWLRANFRKPEDVATAFSVRGSTAWAWWNAENRATGDNVARLFMSRPEAAVWFLEQWKKAA